MLRSVLAVLAGYAAMFVLVFVAMTAAYFALGPDRAFRPRVYEVSVLWIAVWAVISLGAAVAGGWVAARVARNKVAPGALAGVVLALGLVSSIATLNAAPPENPVREPGTPLLEAMSNARAPAWNAFLTPVLGAVGVLAGAALAGPARPKPASNP